MLWTPEGFYEATPGAENVLKWVRNHGPNSAASVLPVSAIANLHRRAALPHVLDQLETEHALGVADKLAAESEVQTATGGVLRVHSIGIEKFGDKAGGLKLKYAAEDADDVATALMNSQKAGSSFTPASKQRHLRTKMPERSPSSARSTPWPTAWRRTGRTSLSFWFRVTV